MGNERLWRMLLAGWAAAVTALSMAPQQLLPPIFGLSDILQHMAAYTIGGACAVLAWRTPRAAAGAALAAAALGGALEIAQAILTSGRSGEWHDLAADAAGVAVGAVSAGFLRRVRRTRRFTEP